MNRVAATLVWHADDEGNLTYVNKQWTEYTGRSAVEELGLGGHQSVHPDDLDHYRAIFKQARAEKDALNAEIRLKHSSGEFRWFLAQVVPLTNESGEVSQFICIYADINQQKQTESNVWVSAQQLRTILENMPVMLVASDEHQNLLVWNRECERVTGYPAEEVLGNNVILKLLAHDEAGVEELMRQWRQFGGEYYDWELPFRCKDGTIRYIEWSNISRQFPIAGWTSWAVGVDVTSHKRAQQRVELLQQIAEGYAQALTVQDVVNVTIDRALKPLNAAVGIMARLNEQARTLEFITTHDFLSSSNPVISLDSDFFLAQTVRSGEPVWIQTSEQLSEQERSYSFVLQKTGIQSAVTVPLIAGGRTIGGLSIGFQQVQTFDEEQKLLVTAVAQQCAQALERAELFDLQRSARLEAERTMTHLLSLQRIAGALSSTLTIEQVGEVIVDQAVDVLGARTGTFQLLSEDEKFLDILYYKGGLIESLERARWKRYPVDPSYPVATLIQTRSPLWFESGEAAASVYPSMAEIAKIHSGAAALLPLIVDYKVIGVLSLVFAEPRTFDEADKEFVLALAHQCAQALQRARLYEREREIVKTNERHRLARDLHDAVSQVLFSSTTRAEVIPRLWQRDPQAAFGQLEQVVKLNRAAMAELRTLLYELRPESITKGDWWIQLRHLVNATQSRLDVETRLVATDHRIVLPDEVHYALYRIAQEALNNATKHSRAKQIDVYFESEDDHLSLRIKDNGEGFDMSKANGGMGLSSMRERAAAIGADLKVTSEPGQGTELQLEWSSSLLPG